MVTKDTSTVFNIDGYVIGRIALPAVFNSPIRPDIISMVHTHLKKNHRQAYSVSIKAGHQTSAQSWGTGRAVSRIPRVPGGGTHRCGQGAFGNMCRGGHMFAPTKIWRRWHRKVNINIKRYAVASAIASSAIPSLVMARGHVIDNLPEVPLVMDNAIESISTTTKAFRIIKAIGAENDMKRVSLTRKIRKGRGKMRNRRHVTRKGPMIIYAKDKGIARASRNLCGLETANVESLDLLKLSPGGHLGRFLIWTESAIASLDHLFGSQWISSQKKGGYILPRSCMENSNIGRLINSDEIQSIVVPPKNGFRKRRTPSKNPLRSKTAMLKLNPYSSISTLHKVKKTHKTEVSREFYRQLIVDSEYEDIGFQSWLGLDEI